MSATPDSARAEGQVSVRRSLGVSTLSRVIGFVLSLGSITILARLLAPEEIGLFSVSAALLGFAHVLREFGVAQYLMQVPEITRQRRRAAFTVTLLLSWSVSLALYLGRDWAAAFYREEGMARIMEVLALNFLVLPFATPLRAQLHRAMRFGPLAVVDLSNQFVVAATALWAAWSGLGYMSLAWASVAGNCTALAALLVISPRGALDWPTWRGLGEVWRFGSRSSAAAFSTEIGTAAPDLVFGRTLGFADVAYFSRANGLLSMALGQLKEIALSVYVPLFARQAREAQPLPALYLQATRMLLALVLPVALMLALLAGPLIALLFGAQWSASAPLGSLLCLFVLIEAPSMLAASSLTVSGHVALMMRCRLLAECARCLVLLLSLWYPLQVVVAALGGAVLVEAALFQWALRRHLGVGSRALWQAVRSSYALALATVLLPALFMVASARYGAWPAWSQLAVAGGLGLAGWLAGLRWLRHPLHAEVWRLLSLGGRWLRGGGVGGVS